MTKKNLKKKLSSERVAQQHAELVKVLCEHVHFRRLVCRLNKKNSNSFLSKVLVEASRRILTESEHLPCRYVFSQSQLAQLEAEFDSHKYINKMKCKNLAYELSINELTAQRWFQRRQYKERQQWRIAPVLPVVQHIWPLNSLQAIAG
ncbi:unnamed protein product [Rotaria sordida]|uniref:Homeobox domain-containing protein n=1 Tax=Rotaria sordida TaxID=392033 RepID=A0A815JSE7_9BILA|nr:unnamed protein product [Rotaria sordida]